MGSHCIYGSLLGFGVCSKPDDHGVPYHRNTVPGGPCSHGSYFFPLGKKSLFFTDYKSIVLFAIVGKGAAQNALSHCFIICKDYKTICYTRIIRRLINAICTAVIECANNKNFITRLRAGSLVYTVGYAD